MKKKYPVILTEAEREQLKSLIAAGTAPARKLTHARILLKADQSPEGPGWVDEKVAEAVEVSQPTVSRVRRQYFEEGLQSALNRHPPKREYHRKLDAEQEARLVALACSEPPEGRARWSLRLLADKLKAVVDPARGECRICVAHGGRAGGLHPPLRSAAVPDLYG